MDLGDSVLGDSVLGDSVLGDSEGLTEATPVDHALDQLSTALDHLVKVVEDGGLFCFDHSQLVGFMQSFERVRNRQSLVDHQVVVAGERCGLPAAVVQPSMRGVLVHLLRLSPGEASRRVSAAAVCAGRTSLVGEVLAPRRPVLAAAQRAGVVSAEQVQIIGRALSSVDRAGFDPGDIAAGERLLTDFAATFGTKDLKALADQTVDAINPDGSLPDEELNADRRQLSVRRCRDGMYAGEFRLTGSAGAKLTALLQPLARPRLDTVGGADGEPKPDPDGRTFGARMHDGLEEVCDRVLAAGDVTGCGGTPATVIVTITVEDSDTSAASPFTQAHLSGMPSGARNAGVTTNLASPARRSTGDRCAKP